MRKITFNRRSSNFLVMLLLVISNIVWAQCPVIANNFQTFCDIQAPKISSLAAQNTGGGVAWFATATSTTPLSPTVGLIDNRIYYADNSAGNCGTRTAVTVRVFSAPDGQNFQGVCVDFAQDATIGDLVATGNNVRWYTSAGSATVLSSTTVLNDNTLYYASQTNPYTGCETSRLKVFVNVGVVPVPQGPSVQEFCGGGGQTYTLDDLQISGNNNWYATLSSAAELPTNTQLVNGQTYYATTVDLPCESEDRLAVTVLIAEANNPGINSTAYFCKSAITSGASINLFDYLAGNPSQVGTWTGPVAITNGSIGTINPLNLNSSNTTFTFTYTVSETICNPESSTLTLIVLPNPQATISGNQSICLGQTAVVNFTGTPNATISYSINGVSSSIVLNASGQASISQAFSQTTTIALTSVTFVGLATCTTPLNQQVVVNVLPLPTAAITASASTICQNAAASITFTGTPNSVVSYLVNGVAATVTLNASGTAVIVRNFSETSTVALTGVVASGTLGCQKSLNQELIISVLPLPTASFTISATSVCAGSSATISITGTPNSTVSYTINNGPVLLINLNAAGTATIVQNYAQTAVINLTGVNYSSGLGCNQVLNQTRTITVLPLPVASFTSTTIQVCNGQNGTVVISGTPNAVVSYIVANGPIQTVQLNNLGQASISVLITQTTSVELVNVFNSTTNCSKTLSQTATFVAVTPPNAGVDVSSITICSNLAGLNLFELLGTTAQAGGIWTPTLASGTNIFNPAFDLAGTYTYTVAGTGPCANDTAFVTVLITPRAVAGISTSVNICSNQSPVNLFTLLGPTAQTGGTWSPALSSGNNMFNPALDLAGIYTYTKAGTGPCSSDSATVTVTITPRAIAGISTSTNVCSNQSPVNLFTLLGSTAQSGGVWSPALASGNNMFDPAFDLAGVYSYTVAGTGPCANNSATVTVTITPKAIAGTNATVNVCSNQAPINLFTLLGSTAQIGGVWSPVLASGSNMFNPALDLAGLYTYTVSGTGPCANNSATVVVTITPRAIAGANATASVCNNQTPINLFTLLGSTAQVGGTWSPALSSGTNMFNPGLDLGGVYTYTVAGTGPCASNSATVTVTVTAQAVAGIDTAVNVCSNQSPINLFTLLGTTAQAGGVWSPALAGGANMFNPLLDQAGSYTYTVSGAGTCANDSAVVIVTITPQAVAGINATVNVCSNQSPVNLFTLLGTTAQTGGSWSPALSSGTNMFNPTVDLAGLYTYTVIGNGPCASNSATVTVSITAQAVAGISATANVCSNQTPINLFTLLGTTAQIGGVWSPALASGNNMFNPALDLAGVYTYTVSGTGPCASNSASVAVTITPQAIAGINAAINLCSNEAAINLLTLLGSTAQSGGTWSPVLASGTNIFNPALDLAGSYTYTVLGVGPCLDNSAVVVVTITPQANAGTSTPVTICSNEAPVNLFTLLGTSAQTGGVWSPTLSSGTGFFNPLVDLQGTYTYTVTGQNSCANNSAQVVVTILVGANPGTNATVILCTNSGLVNLFGYLGTNTTAGGVWTPSLASGTNLFNPLVDVGGAYTYTVGSASCGNYSAIITVDLQSASNAGGNGMASTLTTCLTTTSLDLFTALDGTQTLNGIWLDDNGTGAIVNSIFNPSIVGPGIYQFTYFVAGASSLCGPDSATVIVVVDPQPNAGTFISQPSVCNNGFYDLFNLLSNAQTTGVWTNQNGEVISSLLNVSVLAAGDYTFTYTVTNSCGVDSEIVILKLIPSPVLTPANISAVPSICAGTNLVVNFSNLIDGQYNIEYVLSGTNTSTIQNATVVISSGVGTMILNSTLYPNAGVTTIKFLSITDLLNLCVTNLIDTNLNFIVNPSLNLASSNLSVTSTCFGSAVTIVITNATGLANGVYQFAYSVQNGTTLTGTIGSVSIVNGNGQFTIPSTYFPTTGNYTVLINQAVSEVTGCQNNSLTATVAVEILNGLNTSGAKSQVANACIGNSTTVTLSNLANLQNGNYTINYQLSGANIFTGSALVVIENGNGTFEIPANALVNTGNTVFKVNGLISIATNCATLGENFIAVIFTVYPLPVAVLEQDGNLFCLNDVPTIADLSANILGDFQIEWFSQEFGGVALSESQPLSQGATYYAVVTSADRCESSVRLAVTVDLNTCNDILIPDGFSPNNDGVNDVFEIENIRTIFPNFKIEIFNRYGNIVYKGAKGVPDWDGTASSSNLNLNNSILPIGVYFYILDFNDGSTKPKQGRLYLNR